MTYYGPAPEGTRHGSAWQKAHAANVKRMEEADGIKIPPVDPETPTEADSWVKAHRAKMAAKRMREEADPPE